jgi:hypothetical protein
MHRRARSLWPARFLAALVVVFTILTMTSVAGHPALASNDEPAEPTSRPPVTVSDFIPEDANLSDCVGLVEKPGCGSEARGGWAQVAIFGALAVGLGIIGWRISVGLRANRIIASQSSSTRDDGMQPPIRRET